MFSIEKAVEAILSEGYAGAHTLIFLTRYAALSEDKKLMKNIGNTLEDITERPSPMLAYACAEYYEATGAEFCASYADYILSECGDMLSYAKCAKAFGSERYLAKAEGNDPLGYIEKYKATFNENYLNAAVEIAEQTLNSFHENFDPKDVYDLEQPSGNSRTAVLYDELSRLTEDGRWKEARDKQNKFIALLAEKYPTAATFGMCALLGDEFGSKTVICETGQKQVPKEFLSLLGVYAPTTGIVLRFSEGAETAYYLIENGTKTVI